MATIEAKITGIDHVQVAMPVGAEDIACAFYTGVLGLTEIPKPAHLAASGGAWFECGAGQLHLGGDPAFIAARKAHPALIVQDFDGFGALLAERGVVPAAEAEVGGRRRAGITDPFGNRVELIEQL